MTQPNWPPRHGEAWQRPAPHVGWSAPRSGQPQWGGSWGQPPQWQPPKPNKSSNAGIVVAVLIFVGLGVLAASVLLSLRGPSTPTAQPTLVPSTTVTASPSQEPSPEPSPTPSLEPSIEPSGPSINPGLPARQWPELPGPNSNDPAWVTLQQSVLYTAEMVTLTGCPAPEIATNMRQLEAQVLPQMECIQDAWRPTLASLGLPDHEIPIYFYSGSVVDTPCGQYRAPALYCSAGGGAIYFGEDVINGSSYYEYGVKDVAGHEYGHHLQAQAGMFQASFLTETGDEASRRLELQATCWGYAMLAHDSSVVIDEAAFASFEPYLRLTIEDGIHGSHDSLAYWGIRGLYSTDLGNCNTWTAESEDVD